VSSLKLITYYQNRIIFLSQEQLYNKVCLDTYPEFIQYLIWSQFFCWHLCLILIMLVCIISLYILLYFSNNTRLPEIPYYQFHFFSLTVRKPAFATSSSTHKILLNLVMSLFSSSQHPSILSYAKSIYSKNTSL